MWKSFETDAEENVLRKKTAPDNNDGYVAQRYTVVFDITPAGNMPGCNTTNLEVRKISNKCHILHVGPRLRVAAETAMQYSRQTRTCHVA